MPRGNFDGNIALTASGVPKGVTATFNPVNTSGPSTLTLTAERNAVPTTATITITGKSGTTSHNASVVLSVTPVLSGTVPVDLSLAYNITGIYNDNDESKFSPELSLDGDGFAFSEELLGHEQVGDGVVFHIGPPNGPDMVTGRTIALPTAKFAKLKVLALGVNGDQEMQTFTVTYADGTSSSFTQNLSDWAAPRNFSGESVAFDIPYRLVGDGSRDSRSFYGYAYSFNLDASKVVRSFSLPSNRNVLVLSVTLVP